MLEESNEIREIKDFNIINEYSFSDKSLNGLEVYYILIE